MKIIYVNFKSFSSSFDLIFIQGKYLREIATAHWKCKQYFRKAHCCNGHTLRQKLTSVYELVFSCSRLFVNTWEIFRSDFLHILSICSWQMAWLCQVDKFAQTHWQSGNLNGMFFLPIVIVVLLQLIKMHNENDYRHNSFDNGFDASQIIWT